MFAEEANPYADHDAKHGDTSAAGDRQMTTETGSTNYRQTTSKLSRAALLLCTALGFLQAAGPAAATEGRSGATVPANSWSFRREVLHADLPVVVEFWAPWCGPCRKISPRLDQLASDLRGSVKVVRVNTDESPLYTDLYHVKHLPTVLIVQNGKVQARMEGGDELRALFERLDKVVAAQNARPASVLAALAP